MESLLTSLATPAFFGLLAAAAILVITTNWWVNCAALLAQYAFVAILMTQIVVWRVAVVMAIAGLGVVAILVLTGRLVNYGQRTETEAPAESPRTHTLRFQFPTGLPFRVLVTVMGSVAAWYTASQPDFALPGLPLGLNIASYLLMALGLLSLGLTEEPLNAGIGLFMLLTGFQMFYAAVEPSRAVVALLAAVNMSLALVVSYLALLWYGPLRPRPADETGLAETEGPA